MATAEHACDVSKMSDLRRWRQQNLSCNVSQMENTQCGCNRKGAFSSAPAGNKAECETASKSDIRNPSRFSFEELYRAKIMVAACTTNLHLNAKKNSRKNRRELEAPELK